MIDFACYSPKARYVCWDFPLLIGSMRHARPSVDIEQVSMKSSLLEESIHPLHLFLRSHRDVIESPLELVITPKAISY